MNTGVGAGAQNVYKDYTGFRLPFHQRIVIEDLRFFY